MTKAKVLSIREMKRILTGQTHSLELGTQQYRTLSTEANGLRERLKQIAGENETLRQDIKWYKSLIQNLVTPEDRRNALPR